MYVGDDHYFKLSVNSNGNGKSWESVGFNLSEELLPIFDNLFFLANNITLKAPVLKLFIVRYSTMTETQIHLVHQKGIQVCRYSTNGDLEVRDNIDSREQWIYCIMVRYVGDLLEIETVGLTKRVLVSKYRQGISSPTALQYTRRSLNSRTKRLIGFYSIVNSIQLVNSRWESSPTNVETELKINPSHLIEVVANVAFEGSSNKIQ